jgi:hypothetical protein
MPRTRRAPSLRRGPQDRRALAGVRWVRLVLAWFLLSLGTAMAAPMVQPQGFELICSGTGGAKVLVLPADHGGIHELGASHLDCPLCLPAGAPPPLPLVGLPPLLPSAEAPRAAPVAVPGVAAALPPPARGPPNRV